MSSIINLNKSKKRKYYARGIWTALAKVDLQFFISFYYGERDVRTNQYCSKKVLAKPLEIGQILGNFVSKVALEVSRDLHGRC